MDLHDDRTRARLRHHLGGLLRGRRLVCGIGPLAGLVDWVALVEESGGERPLLVASGVGAGPTPTAEQAEVVFVDLPTAPSMTEDLRRHDRLVRDLPAPVVAAVEAYDPDGRAGWVVSPFIGTSPILGREVLTGRPDAWSTLEDKLVADALWDAVGVPRAPSRTVPVDADALRRASTDLDRGDGVVWAGDARDGFNGGGDFVRWVASGDDGAAAAGRGVLRRPLRPGPGDAVPGGRAVQHPRPGAARRHRGLPAGRARHPAPARPRLRVRRPRHVVGPAPGRPRADARPGPADRGAPAAAGGLPGRLRRRRRPHRRRLPADGAQHADVRRARVDGPGRGQQPVPPAPAQPARGSRPRGRRRRRWSGGRSTCSTTTGS